MNLHLFARSINKLNLFFERGIHMSFGDKTGPLGQGPMTGRGAGFCGGFAVPGGMNSGQGRGMGRGGLGGFGQGWRHQFNATGLRGWQRAAAAIAPVSFASAADERQIAALKTQATSLQATLGQMQERIEELESRPKPE
jgi:hypothetical protein